MNKTEVRELNAKRDTLICKQTKKVNAKNRKKKERKAHKSTAYGKFDNASPGTLNRETDEAFTNTLVNQNVGNDRRYNDSRDDAAVPSTSRSMPTLLNETTSEPPMDALKQAMLAAGLDDTDDDEGTQNSIKEGAN